MKSWQINRTKPKNRENKMFSLQLTIKFARIEKHMKLGGVDMPNIKSQKKRVITNNKRHEIVKSKKSAVKTAIKNVEKAVAANDLAAAQEAYKIACSRIDKSVTAGVHHKNYANRQKSRLSTLVNSLS